MENFVVSARKYRPDKFETVVGQPSITKTLKNAIKANQLAHAYLFCGPRGVGKTTCARIFAKTINCFNLGDDTEACGECESCKSFQENRSFSIHELDAASNNHVDDIRNLIDQVRIPPQVGKYSIYIIDEVHMLSQQAFNAFLKTLEEPPEHAIFILATTEKHKIIPTILSRCQIFDFNRIGVIEIMNHLRSVAEREQVNFEDAALNIIAQKADGSMRDALSIFDQVVSFSGNHVDYQTVVSNLNVLDYDYYFKLTDYFLCGDYRGALMTYNEILNKGFDSHNFINGLGGHFRNLLVSHDPETIQLLELSGEIAQRYADTVKRCGTGFLFEALDEINKSDIQFKQAKDPRLHVEICLLKLSRIAGTIELSENPVKLVQKKVAQEEKSVRAEEKSAGAEAKTLKAEEKLDLPEEKATESVSKKQTDRLDDTTVNIEAESKPATPVAPSKPGFNGLRATPKLSDFMSKKPAGSAEVESEKVAFAIDGPVVELNQDNLKAVWKDFAETIKEGQPRIYNTLISTEPELKGGSVLFNLNNPLQKKALSTIHNELEGYIKQRTGSENLIVETSVAEIEKREKKLFTQDDKYQHLKEQNPNLDMFRQKMNLDFE